MSHPNRRARRIKITAGLAAILALGVGLASYTRANGADKSKAEKEKKEKEPAPVAVQAVTPGPISAYVTATANLVAEDEVKVVAEAEGKVVELLADEGADVAKGQKLVQIDKSEAVLGVQKAELALRNAALNLDRAERMAADKLISVQDLDKARYARDVARHALDEARYRLEKTTVTAPFAGRITIRRVQLGQTVKLNDELFTLADLQPLVARIFLPEREVLDLKLGQDVQLALKAREDVRFRGRIRQISPVVDTASGTVKVTVEAVAPPPSVRPGAFVGVGIVRETHEDALLVARGAVVRELQETYVYVASGGKALRRGVRVGLEEGDNVELLSGVKAGEQVVTSGQGALKDQAAIKVAPAASAS